MMKNLTVALALVAVLAMVGTTFADLTIGGTTEGVDLGNGLTAYTITSMGVNSFTSVTVTDAHQVWANPGGSDIETPLTSSFQTYFPNYLDALASDTHFLLTKGGEPITLITVGNVAWGETNNLESPIDPEVPEGFAAYHEGMGELTMGGTNDPSFGWAGGDYNPATECIDLMRVVVPTGKVAYLTATGKLGSETFTVTNLQIGEVPEPSTIIMLIAGGLCLLAVRRRK